MHTGTLNYYKESGIASIPNVILSLICASLLLLFTSYFYSLIVNFMPFIYLNFLIVAVFGLIVSLTSKAFCIVFKIRNLKKSKIITLVLAFLAIYFQWVSYVFIISSENLGLFMIFNQFSHFMNILLNPVLLVDSIIEINSIGLWSLGFSKINITGGILWGVWLFEALIIIAVAYIHFSKFEIIPFSEKSRNWFKKEFIDLEFERISFTNDFLKAFQLNPSQAILNLEKGNGTRYSKISIFSAKTEPKSIITINNIIIRERGKGQKEITPVLMHCYIDTIHLKKIKENFILKKAKTFDY